MKMEPIYKNLLLYTNIYKSYVYEMKMLLVKDKYFNLRFKPSITCSAGPKHIFM